MNYLQIQNLVLPTLVAVTLEEHQQGLMHQQWPPPIMTFSFDQPGVHKFWMKNTPCPLDIIFCYKNKVFQIEAGRPYSLTKICPEMYTDLVIEMPQGLAKELNINPGQLVVLNYSVPTLAKLYQQRLFK